MTNLDTIDRAIGRLEGKVDGINNRLDTKNGMCEKHLARLRIVESYQDKQKGISVLLGVVGAGTVLIAKYVWSYLIKMRVI